MQMLGMQMAMDHRSGLRTPRTPRTPQVPHLRMRASNLRPGHSRIMPPSTWGELRREVGRGLWMRNGEGQVDHLARARVGSSIKTETNARSRKFRLLHFACIRKFNARADIPELQYVGRVAKTSVERWAPRYRWGSPFRLCTGRDQPGDYHQSF
jgi:hypothetical protein